MKEKLIKIYKAGVDGSLYLILQVIAGSSDVKELIEITKIQGSILMLLKKELIEQVSSTCYQLSEKGKQLFKDIGEYKEEQIEIIQNPNRIENILLSLKAELKSHIGKEQILGFGKKYFIPTLPELTKALNDFWKVYSKFKDLDRIETILINHVKTCCKKQSFAPSTQYFIIKDRINSYLAGAYENFKEEENEQINNTTDTFI